MAFLRLPVCPPANATHGWIIIIIIITITLAAQASQWATGANTTHAAYNRHKRQLRAMGLQHIIHHTHA
jgi:hypothetical protein